MNQSITPAVATRTGFNLFVYLHGDLVYALGGVRHDEDLNAEEMSEFLKSEVPCDALNSCRQSFKPTNFTKQLADGTAAIPLHMFEELRGSGKDIQLFDGIFEQLDAPEDFVVCLTRVQDGVPVNDDGPIYFEGSPEMDNTYRHSIFLLKHIETLRVLALSQFKAQGRGAIVAMADPHPSDYEHREVRFLPQAECNLTEPVWEKVRQLVSDYNPEKEMVIVFLGPNTDKAYTL